MWFAAFLAVGYSDLGMKLKKKIITIRIHFLCVLVVVVQKSREVGSMCFVLPHF